MSSTALTRGDIGRTARSITFVRIVSYAAEGLKTIRTSFMATKMISDWGKRMYSVRRVYPVQHAQRVQILDRA